MIDCIRCFGREARTFIKNVQKMCRIVDTYNGCLERPVAEECGAEALSFFRQVYNKAKSEAFDECKVNDEVTDIEHALNGDAPVLPGAEISEFFILLFTY